jgi:TonB-dependent starch-binding outer membrane protein SusC
MKKILSMMVTVLLCTVNLLAQSSISGKVQDQAGNPLSGANVSGKKNNTSTNATGNFTIAAERGESLTISLIGYTTQKVSASEGMVVSMVQRVSSETEVVVTGYQSLQKRGTTGAIATVKEEAIKNVPIASFDQILQGQAAGALIQSNSGQPGAAANVIIRGVGSVNGTTQPLYIVDGIQISAANFSSLNPNDFASVSVLKDASTTAPYGSRGANGVIVITTKKGKAGKTKIEYTGIYGESRFPENKLRLMNTNEKLDYEVARGNPYGWTAAELADLRKINTNWQDEIDQVGLTRSHQLSASGGSDKTTFYLSGAIFNQRGTIKTTGLERYSGRMNIDHKAHDNVKIGINAYAGWSDFTNTSEGNTTIAAPLNAIRWANPYEKPYDANGNYTAIVSGQPNPVQDINETKRGTKELKLIANGYLEAQLPFITKGLSFRTNWGVDNEGWDQTTLFTRFSVVGQAQAGNNGLYAKTSRTLTRYTGTTSLNYAKSIKDHSFNVGLYTEYVKRKFQTFGYTGYGLTGNFQNGQGITNGNPAFMPNVNENQTVNALASYFAIGSYNFKNRYFFNGSFRRDGSSRFGKNFRYANFYSVGAGWVISDENFFQNVGFIDNLKYSISYGTAGNQEGIGDFASRELFGRATYNGTPGPSIFQLPNPDLTWEEREKFNTGINASAFKGRLVLGIDFYTEITNRLFLNNQLSRTTGFTALNTNIGKVRNRGWEFTLISENLKLKDFTWTTNLNFTVNRNKVLALTPTTPETGIATGLTIQRVGFPLNSNYLVGYAGVNPANGNSIYEKADKSTTETFSLNDRQIFGTRDAPYFGGITNKFSFKGVDLSVFFNFLFGNKVYNNDRVNVEDPSYYFDNMSAALLSEWRTPGQVTNIPRPTQAMRANTTRFLENGGFLRLRNIQLGYSLPSSILKKAKLGSVRLFVQGENLWTKTEFLGFDPEFTGGQLTGAQYPALRTVTGGITIGF